jgi:hypothetical protein
VEVLVAPRSLRSARLATVIAAVLLLGVMIPSTALAGQRERSHWSVTFPGGVIDCGSFEDHFTDYYDVAETDIFDKGGNLVKVTYHIEHHSDDMNSVTGLTLHEHGHYTETDDLVAGTYTLTGNEEIINRPGRGVVVQDVGRIVYDSAFNITFFAGGRNHSEVLNGGQVLCDALS